MTVIQQIHHAMSIHNHTHNNPILRGWRKAELQSGTLAVNSGASTAPAKSAECPYCNKTSVGLTKFTLFLMHGKLLQYLGTFWGKR